MKTKEKNEWELTLAQRLRTLRKSLSLSTAQVANALGITDAGYRNLENAVAAPPAWRLIPLAPSR